MSRLVKSSVIIVFVLSAPMAAGAQSTPGRTPVKATLSDSEFVMKAADGGQKEVAAGKLGASQATNPNVKAFAQRMVADHTAANDELVKLAKSENIEVPSEHKAAEPNPKAAASAGAEFDRTFMKQMVEDHQATVDLFDAEVRDGKDAEIKAWAAKTLPKLREHLKEARDLLTKVSR